MVKSKNATLGSDNVALGSKRVALGSKEVSIIVSSDCCFAHF
jgi:hypothetical protein